MPVTITEVMVTVEKPATIIFGRIAPSMAATSSGVSPAPKPITTARRFGP